MKAELGDTVIVIYDGMTETGEIFDSSETSGPLEFVVGTGSVLPGFEENIIGMNEGESKSFSLTPEAAHGPSNPELIHTIARQGIPGQKEIKVGMVLGLTVERDGQEHKVPANVVALNKESITVDFNHPLAGQTLSYKVTLQSVAKRQAQTPVSPNPAH